MLQMVIILLLNATFFIRKITRNQSLIKGLLKAILNLLYRLKVVLYCHLLKNMAKLTILMK